MLKEIFPLSELKITILSELYQEPKTLASLEKNIPSLKQTIFKALKSLNNIINKNKNNVYSIKEEYLKIFKPILKQQLIENRLGKNIIILDLIKKYYNPKKIILFGSYIRNENTINSDIDLYVISELDDKKNQEFRLKFSKSLKKEIQIINVNPKEQNSNKNKFQELYNKISNDLTQGIEI